MKLKLIFVFLVLMIVTACSNGQSASNGREQNENLGPRAQAVAVDFYSALSQGAYDQAALLYGGSYEMLQGFNPEIDPTDQVKLLGAGCEFNGLMCLPVLDLSFVEVNDQQEYVFEVTFANPDGSQFILGPCCGATEEEMPPMSEFPGRVACQRDGACLVLDLPPYVP
jgi:hypothetical protein